MLFRVEALQYCGRLTSDVHLLQFVTFPSALPLNEFLYICTGLFHDQTLFAFAPRFIFIAWQFHLYNTENMKKDDTRMKFVLMETKKLSELVAENGPKETAATQMKREIVESQAPLFYSRGIPHSFEELNDA
jgi:hypothetical protein